MLIVSFIYSSNKDEAILIVSIIMMQESFGLNVGVTRWNARCPTSGSKEGVFNSTVYSQHVSFRGLGTMS